MRTILKFPIRIGSVHKLPVPDTAIVRLVAIDPASGQLAIWIELDPNAPKVIRSFAIFGTGEVIEDAGGAGFDTFVGSVIHGEFVWHIYERMS